MPELHSTTTSRSTTARPSTTAARRLSTSNVDTVTGRAARATSSPERTRAYDRTPPTFLWSTADDEAVPVGNTLRYAKALTERGVPTELLVLPHGRHGLGLAPEDPAVAGWSRLCAEWLQRGGWTGPGQDRTEPPEGTPA